MSPLIAPFWRRLLPGAGLSLLVSALGWRCSLSRSDSSPAPAAQRMPAAVELTSACLAALPPSVSPEPRLARARAVARTHSDQPESWVDLGQAWLRQARRSADAGYALNANDWLNGCVMVTNN